MPTLTKRGQVTSCGRATKYGQLFAETAVWVLRIR